MTTKYVCLETTDNCKNHNGENNLKLYRLQFVKIQLGNSNRRSNKKSHQRPTGCVNSSLSWKQENPC